MNFQNTVGNILQSVQSALTPKADTPIQTRCKADLNTKLRLKYQPYYHSADAAKGIQIQCEGKDMIMMSTNEYLGLSQHPKVIAAAQKALAEWGTSSCGSRLANGSRKYHLELEEELAAFLGKEACHVFSAGYLACMSGIAGLAQKGDAIIIDRNVHACLWDASSLCPGTVERFNHEDMNSLEQLLASLEPSQPKILVIDGVYSMEGHVASLPRIVELAKQHEAFIVLDDAHGFGVLGREGRGTSDNFGLTEDVGLIAGSFSKSLASIGGFIAGDRSVIEYMRTTCRQIIFSAALPPASAAAARAALQILQEEPQHLQRLQANSEYLRKRLDDAGLDYWQSTTAAIPIVIGDKMKCYDVWKDLWEDGFFTVLSTSPGVPVGKDLIRCAVSALHTTEMLDRFVDSISRACRKAGVLKG